MNLVVRTDLVCRHDGIDQQLGTPSIINGMMEG